MMTKGREVSPTHNNTPYAHPYTKQQQPTTHHLKVLGSPLSRQIIPSGENKLFVPYTVIIVTIAASNKIENTTLMS